MKSRGFTLIELLVVIAIIGLLSSIVLASLGTARNKGRDAAVQSELHSVAQQAELIRGPKTCYPGPSGLCAGTAQALSVLTTTCTTNTAFLCNNPTILQELNGALDANNGGMISIQWPVGATSYAIIVQLATDSGLAWCIDSTGQSKREGTPGTPLTATSFPLLATNYVCN